MKRAFCSGRLAWTGVLLLGTALFVTAQAATETFQVDAVHSSAEFKVRHLLSKVGGRFGQFGGVLQYDAQDPRKSSIEFTVQVASIDTDNANRDDHLRGDDFFDAAKYPTITFKSTKIEPAGKDGLYKVTGDFTMRGVKKSIVVDAEVLGFADTEMGMRGGVDVKTTLDRKEYGIIWNKVMDQGGALLGDDVSVDISLAFFQPGEQ